MACGCEKVEDTGAGFEFLGFEGEDALWVAVGLLTLGLLIALSRLPAK